MAKNAAHVSPAGPPPITATFFFCMFFSLSKKTSLKFILFFTAMSKTKASKSPILTGVPFIPLTQLPWHCFLCGQILPHTPGRTVVKDNI